MFPSLDTIPDISDTEIDRKYTEVMHQWMNPRYTCLLKYDYSNERKILEARNDKKNKKKDITPSEISPAPDFYWNYNFAKRIKTKIDDTLNCSNGQMTQTIEYRNFSSAILQTANSLSSQSSALVQEITSNLQTLRKKDKQFYRDKKPTPYSFWEGEFNRYYPYASETSQSSKQYQDNINISLNQLYRSSDLSRGEIPSQMLSLIEFVVNTLLRVAPNAISDADVASAVNAHNNTIDSLMEYSLGNMISLMKLIFFALYNPLNGLLLNEKDLIQSFMITDIQSFSNYLIVRLMQQFPVLQDPVFTGVLTGFVYNAVFCITAPIFEDTFRNEQDVRFKRGIDTIKETDFTRFGIIEELMEEQNADIQRAIQMLDSAAVMTSPYYRISMYGKVMNTLFTLVSARYISKGKEMNAMEVMDSITRFMIVMTPDHFCSNLSYCIMYVKCIPNGVVNNDTIQYLNRGLSMLMSLIQCRVC